MEEHGQAALRRVLAQAGDPDLAGRLAALPGSELTTLLLEVLRRKAVRLTPAEVMRRYGTDRFVAPAAVGFAAQRRAEDVMLAALPPGFDVLTLAPVLPLGAHSAVATVDPRKVIATVRGTEVAADPTNGLALEAAVRRRGVLRRQPRSAERIRLAATQRVARAQYESGPVSFAHFQLLGAVTAGRDTGSHAFERDSAVEHLRFAVAGLLRLGARRVRVELTCLDDRMAPVSAAIAEALAAVPDLEAGGAEARGVDAGGAEAGGAEAAGVEAGGVEAGGVEAGGVEAGGVEAGGVEAGRVEAGRAEAGGVVEVADTPQRQSGRGYYTGLCFKVYAAFGGPELEVGDGGFVDWTQKLLDSHKERLLISGYGIDRIAIASAA